MHFKQSPWVTLLRSMENHCLDAVKVSLRMAFSHSLQTPTSCQYSLGLREGLQGVLEAAFPEGRDPISSAGICSPVATWRIVQRPSPYSQNKDPFHSIPNI